MRGQKELYKILEDLNIEYLYFEHPPVATVEEAIKHWKEIHGFKCKNLFFRNHKGNQHYLVILEYMQHLAIKDLEKRLNQGKLSFASDKRLNKYLGLSPGSVSPFGLINDKDNHVKVFLDTSLKTADKIGFHPNVNTAKLVISFEDFERFLRWTGNEFEYIDLGVDK